MEMMKIILMMMMMMMMKVMKMMKMKMMIMRYMTPGRNSCCNRHIPVLAIFHLRPPGIACLQMSIQIPFLTLPITMVFVINGLMV